jgi:hypothetical protein
MLVKSMEVKQIQRVYQVRHKLPGRRGKDPANIITTASVCIPLQTEKSDSDTFLSRELDLRDGIAP